MWDSSPLFIAASGPTKPQKHVFSCYFVNIGSVSKKVNDLLASPSNQFRDYSIWNRIERLVPQLWNFAPQTLQTVQKTTKLCSNLDFLTKSGFPKTRDLSPAAPWGVYISRKDPPKTKIWEIAKTFFLSPELQQAPSIGLPHKLRTFSYGL